MPTQRTILLKGRGIAKEGVAGGAITPGMLVALNSSGKYIAHNAAGKATTPVFARENELAGKGINTAYALDDTVFVEAVGRGCEVYALVAANAAAIVIGDKLVSDGAGGLKKATTPADVGASFNQTAINNAVTAAAETILAIALEAVDNSANASAARLTVEIV